MKLIKSATAALAFAAFVLAAKAEAKESFDLTKLPLTDRSFDAILGNDEQQMEIVFLTMKKKSKNEYEVTGKSKVKTNICDFKGTMKVQKEEELDTEGENAFAHGQAIGTYLFSEDKKQKGTGTFKGEFKIAWANWENGIGFADFGFGDAVSFKGSWTSYTTGKSKKADWCNVGWCGTKTFNDGGEPVIDEKYRRTENKEIWWKKK
jgi:hypothetical protein